MVIVSKGSFSISFFNINTVKYQRYEEYIDILPIAASQYQIFSSEIILPMQKTRKLNF